MISDVAQLESSPVLTEWRDRDIQDAYPSVKKCGYSRNQGEQAIAHHRGVMYPPIARRLQYAIG